MKVKVIQIVNQTAEFSHVCHHTMFKTNQIKSLWIQVNVTGSFYEITDRKLPTLHINCKFYLA